MIDPRLRASDADRQRVVGALARHVAAGRLTLDEYEQRLDRALAASTHGELSAITGDLPAEESAAAPSRQLLVAFLVAVLALVVLAVILGLAR